jgi:hypothetical protein
MRGAAKEIPSTASASTPAARADDGADVGDGVGDGVGADVGDGSEAADTGAERMRRSYRAEPDRDTGARLLAVAWPA